MSAFKQLLENNDKYSSTFSKGSLPMPPAKKISMVVCMDARMVTGSFLGLQEGDAHVIRNAGGIVTDDVIRSLAISQHMQGTREIMLIHHTDCGMLTFTDAEFKQRLYEKTGTRPEFSIGTFSNLENSVRESIQQIKNSPFIPHKDQVRGFIYDVKTGKLNEVN